MADPLRLSERELAVAVALAEQPRHALLERPEAQAHLAALRAAKVVEPGGTLAAPAARILRVVARPHLRVNLRTSDSDLRAWADERDAVTGLVAGGTVALELLPRDELPRALVATAGLAGGAGAVAGDSRAPLSVAPAVLVEAQDLLRAGVANAALERLRAAAPGSPRAVGEALAVADGLRGGFVARGSWREPEGEWHAGTVAALDAGPAGWWTFAPDDGEIPLEPADAHGLIHRLVELLP